MKAKIPRWISVYQALLCLILLWQTVNYYQLQYDGLVVESLAHKRQTLELAGRTLVMVVIGLVAIISRNPHYFVIAFIVNALREGHEGIIDPLFDNTATNRYPLFNALFHYVLVALDIVAIIKVYKISRQPKESKI